MGVLNARLKMRLFQVTLSVLVALTLSSSALGQDTPAAATGEPAPSEPAPSAAPDVTPPGVPDANPEGPPQTAPTSSISLSPDPDTAPSKEVTTLEAEKSVAKAKDKPAKKEMEDDVSCLDPEKCKKYREFVKGELLTVGATDLLGKRSRAGVKLGYRAIGHTHYGTVEPGTDLRFGDFHLGLAVPLNIEIWDGSGGLVSIDASNADAAVGVNGFENAGSIRSEDWDHWRDYFRVLKHVGWGRKEDFFYVNVSQDGAANIGHGLIMKRYMPQVDIDSTRVGMQLDAYLDWLGGFEFYTNDVTNWSMLGTLAFIKPLGPFIDSVMARSFSIGVSFVTDLNAPVTLASADRKFALDADLDNTSPLAASTTTASIWGIDAELKVVKNDNVDVKVYVDYSNMIDAGYGIAAGALGRFNVGSSLVHAFRARLESRFFTGNYEPSYFDSFYEIDKWQFLSGVNRYGTGADPTAAIRTKYDAITSRPDDMQFGYFIEAAYSILGYVSIGAALEGQSPESSYGLLVHLDAPVLDYVRLKATYQKRHMQDFGGAFSFSEDNEWLSAMARIQVLPVLFINAEAGHLWRLNRDEFTAGSKKGQPGPDFGLYQAGWDFRFWFDAAWEW
jgi:hypothetical protein